MERAVMRRDRVAKEAMVGLPARLGAFLAEPDAQGRRCHDVGEKDRGRAGGAFGRLRGHRSTVYCVCARRVNKKR